jgi:uncharacterized protein (DUF1800 family)
MTTLHAAIAANRFGLGARPGELARIASDPRGWLKAQVDGAYAPPPQLAGLESSAAILAEFQEDFMDRREQRDPAAEFRRMIREDLVSHYFEQVRARVASAVETDRPFRERLTHFWTNHFAVSADKPPVTGLAGTLENEAIRPHVGGYFVDMLLAVERHPAMLTYLDNQRSVGPGSMLARRAERRLRSTGRTAGINENLAREILELHTLGVDGGYTQQDVVELSRALTGWSLSGGRGPLAAGDPGHFLFREIMHEPGTRRVLGKRYPDDGERQAERILSDLALHEATARHIGSKLARHFAADQPPAALSETLTRRFLETGGYLPAVYAALIDAPEVWKEPLAKYKTPNDFVLSALRAMRFVPEQARMVVAFFDVLGQRTYGPGSPAGWPDQQSHWDGSDALLKRVEWAIAVGNRIGDLFEPIALASDVLGAVLSEHTRKAIRQAASAGQGLALLLASPEFQRR